MIESASDEARILLVDDDSRIVAFLARALGSSGARVTSASTGAEALDILGKETFDIVLSDIQMPGMSGLKLLRAVREYDMDLPVVLMTGEPNLSGAATAVEYGAFQYLIKPVGLDRLRAVIARAVAFGRIARLKRQCAGEYSSKTFFVGDRAGVEAKLNRALQTLWMAYQSIVTTTGDALGYEAFLRTKEPMLPHPGAVLKAAERVQRTQDVGRAIRDLVASEVTCGADETSLVFVNLHSEDLLDPVLYLANAALTRIAPRVVFELTDRVSLDAIRDVESRVARLRALGFRIALDDLGAGEAGLKTITRLEPEFVKLDLSVVRGVDRDRAKQQIVKSLVQVCHGMGKLVIAEGVETADERDALIGAGCDLLQGYYFGRPSPFLDLPPRRVAPIGVAS